MVMPMCRKNKLFKKKEAGKVVDELRERPGKMKLLCDNREDKAKAQSSRNAKRKEEGEGLEINR